MAGNSTPEANGSARSGVEQHHRTKGLLRLSMACNERCPFCNVPVEDYRQVTPPAQDVERALQAFVDAGQRTLTISGGEPTLLRRRLVELIRQARQRGVPFAELQTNAVLIDQGYAAELAAAGLTSAFVPLLSHRATLHDELMARDGAWAQCLSGIDALLAAGVRVTLNPVLAYRTQSLVAEYVDFVARRLPQVQAISLSAVQPHGRAAGHLDLLPDYAVLAEAVAEAQRRASAHHIELLNPYCGLPLCVGWSAHVDRCVEAIEARQARGAGFGDVPGVSNRGNKCHGDPCRGCALRTRCGGAWHAYWDHRGGSGLQPPLPRCEPWHTTTDRDAGQHIVTAAGLLDDGVLAELTGATTPTVWLSTSRLRQGDVALLAAAGCTDLALTLDTSALLADRELTGELRRLAHRNADALPQAVLRVAVALRPTGSFAECYDAVRWAAAVGADAVRLPVAPDSRWTRFVAAVQAELPGLDVTILEGHAP